MGDPQEGRRWWQWRRKQQPGAGVRNAPAPPSVVAGPPGGPPVQEAGMFMRGASGAGRWEAVPPWPLERRVRMLYRQLVEHWGSSRDDLRLVSLPLLLWIGPELALALPGGMTVLARGRPDRRVQVHHFNRDQTLTFSAGRLEQDPVASWTNPLRQALFDWLSEGMAVTGADLTVLCTGPATWHAACLEAMACALACYAPAWAARGRQDQTRRAIPLPWPAHLRWPEPWQKPARAFAALSSGAAESGDEGRSGWRLVVLGPSGAAAVAGAGQLEVVEAAEGEAAEPRGVPLRAAPPGRPASTDADRAVERFVQAAMHADGAAIRDAIEVLAAASTAGEPPVGWLVANAGDGRRAAARGGAGMARSEPAVALLRCHRRTRQP